MKMLPEHYDSLQNYIKALDTPIKREQYKAGQFPNADKVKDLDKRYRWDLLYASGFNTSRLYSYLNDDHIDTALRKLVAPLSK